MDDAKREMTYGEKAVGLTFNPGNRRPDVQECKRRFAELIGEMDALRSISGRGEQARLASVAITDLQVAQIWCVKALTWPD